MTKVYYKYHLRGSGEVFFIQDSHLFGGRQAWINIQGPIPEDEVIRIRDALDEFLADKDVVLPQERI